MQTYDRLALKTARLLLWLCVYGNLRFRDMRSCYSRSHDAVIRVYDAAANVIETHEQKGEFKER